MAIAALCGFGVAAQFVTIEALEQPYYVVLLGAGTLLIHHRQYENNDSKELDDQEGPSDPPGSDWRHQVVDQQEGDIADWKPVVMN